MSKDMEVAVRPALGRPKAETKDTPPLTSESSSQLKPESAVELSEPAKPATKNKLSHPLEPSTHKMKLRTR